MGAIVKDSHMTFNGVKYFRGNATAVPLGAFGRKKTPVFGTNYLEVDGHLQLNTTIAPATVVDLDTSSSNQGEAMANVRVLNVAGGTVSGSWQNFQEHKLKLVEFCLELGQVKTLVAGNANARDLLEDNRNTGRVAYQIWVVMEATEASAFQNSGSLTVHATVNGVQITAGASNTSTGASTVTISSGSTYAYLLAKPRWEGKSIDGFTSDQWGP